MIKANLIIEFVLYEYLDIIENSSELLSDIIIHNRQGLREKNKLDFKKNYFSHASRIDYSPEQYNQSRQQILDLPSFNSQPIRNEESKMEKSPTQLLRRINQLEKQENSLMTQNETLIEQSYETKNKISSIESQLKSFQNILHHTNNQNESNSSRNQSQQQRHQLHQQQQQHQKQKQSLNENVQNNFMHPQYLSNFEESVNQESDVHIEPDQNNKQLRQQSDEENLQIQDSRNTYLFNSKNQMKNFETSTHIKSISCTEMEAPKFEGTFQPLRNLARIVDVLDLSYLGIKSEAPQYMNLSEKKDKDRIHYDSTSSVDNIREKAICRIDSDESVVKMKQAVSTITGVNNLLFYKSSEILSNNTFIQMEEKFQQQNDQLDDSQLEKNINVSYLNHFEQIEIKEHQLEERFSNKNDNSKQTQQNPPNQMKSNHSSGEQNSGSGQVKVKPIFPKVNMNTLNYELFQDQYKEQLQTKSNQSILKQTNNVNPTQQNGKQIRSSEDNIQDSCEISVNSVIKSNDPPLKSEIYPHQITSQNIPQSNNYQNEYNYKIDKVDYSQQFSFDPQKQPSQPPLLEGTIAKKKTQDHFHTSKTVKDNYLTNNAYVSDEKYLLNNVDLPEEESLKYFKSAENSQKNQNMQQNEVSWFTSPLNISQGNKNKLIKSNLEQQNNFNYGSSQQLSSVRLNTGHLISLHSNSSIHSLSMSPDQPLNEDNSLINSSLPCQSENIASFVHSNEILNHQEINKNNSEISKGESLIIKQYSTNKNIPNDSREGRLQITPNPNQKAINQRLQDNFSSIPNLNMSNSHTTSKERLMSTSQNSIDRQIKKSTNTSLFTHSVKNKNQYASVSKYTSTSGNENQTVDFKSLQKNQDTFLEKQKKYHSRQNKYDDILNVDIPEFNAVLTNTNFIKEDRLPSPQKDTQDQEVKQVFQMEKNANFQIEKDVNMVEQAQNEQQYQKEHSIHHSQKPNHSTPLNSSQIQMKKLLNMYKVEEEKDLGDQEVQGDLSESDEVERESQTWIKDDLIPNEEGIRSVSESRNITQSNNKSYASVPFRMVAVNQKHHIFYGVPNLFQPNESNKSIK